MLTKLAFKNVGKSFRDYAVYFFTLVFGVCIFYMFNSIYAQKDMMAVTETTNAAMTALREVISYVSIFVAVVLGFLIVYANNFFIKRRKKELGIYLTLGMTKGKISTILVLETSLMAIIALIVGLLLGVFGSQFMSVITAKMFEVDMTGFKFIFSSDAAIKSILYFGVIFLIVILFNTVAISRFKLIDLLYGGRKNETLKIKKTWISVAIFVVSIVCLGIAYYLILWNGIIDLNKYFTMSIVLGIIGTLMFFFSLAGLLTKLVRSSKKVYFKNLNMFVMRQLNSKINTNFVSISVVCIVLLLVIGIFSCGYSVQKVFSNELQEKVKYDISMYKDPIDGGKIPPIYENLSNNIKEFDGIKDYGEYAIYLSKNPIEYKDFNINLGKYERLADNSMEFISLSDYNKTLKLQGLPLVSLPENKYLVVSDKKEEIKKIADQLTDKKNSIKLKGAVLTAQPKVKVGYLSNEKFRIYIVVNDRYVDGMNEIAKVLNIQCNNFKEAKKLNNIVGDYNKKFDFGDEKFVFYNSKADIYRESVTTKAIVSFLAIYLGSVFMITCAAILAIQQLSETSDNKGRYDLLKKLGADKKMLNKALFVQILSYFLLPLLLAIIHSIFGLTAANDVISQFGRMNVGTNIAATAAFVVAIYGAYFGITYIGSKSIINKE